jgi:alpha-D-ribose 1-methylphosphonate 5-triphosphate synthase subunit PhnI
MKPLSRLLHFAKKGDTLVPKPTIEQLEFNAKYCLARSMKEGGVWFDRFQEAMRELKALRIQKWLDKW